VVDGLDFMNEVEGTDLESFLFERASSKELMGIAKAAEFFVFVGDVAEEEE